MNPDQWSKTQATRRRASPETLVNSTSGLAIFLEQHRYLVRELPPAVSQGASAINELGLLLAIQITRDIVGLGNRLTLMAEEDFPLALLANIDPIATRGQAILGVALGFELANDRPLRQLLGVEVADVGGGELHRLAAGVPFDHGVVLVELHSRIGLRDLILVRAILRLGGIDHRDAHQTKRRNQCQ